MRFAGLQAFWGFIRRPRVLDTILVSVLFTAGALAAVASVHDHPELALGAGVFAVSALPLLVRRSHPVIAATITVVLDVAASPLSQQPAPGLTASIALYSVGRHSAGRTSLIVAILAGAANMGNAAVLRLVRDGSENLVGELLSAVVGPVFCVCVGTFFRLRGEIRTRRVQQAAEEAVRTERRHIARELHDVVAHHISVINALVGGARAAMEANPSGARDALLSAEETARQALAEMRQLLDVLRADGDTETTPAAGAVGLPGLIEQAGSAGLPARLEITGEVVPLPALVDHAVYRIVQESLTNTRKHAAGARADVRVSYESDAVEVEVLDDGMPVERAVGGFGRQPSGFGLGGMAERVAMCHGQLQTGPRPDGGFRVYARFPLPVLPRPTVQEAHR
ncbi:sensor histidine kinase [Rhizohabitans arisaemae]|uniref:sensor histidine kinase n=1 Tax=Rhizohabitans arisaemae TaxID=2720610 RepID=UPI0024B1EA96|nr:histidine kinase [Rhizohabitans arisaemae]